MTARVLVTGSAGLVGRELMAALAASGIESVGGDLPALDVRDPAGLRRAVAAAGADWIVNLAAFTDVDGCERDEPGGRLAGEVNAGGAGHAASVAAERGCILLQVSTDYVFDGRKDAPYDESDEPSPISVYGRSKSEGERRVREALPADRWLIVRGQSLYGAGRKSFPDSILGAAGAKTEIPVVTDQFVSPTWARDFAQGLVALLRADARGFVHLSASGSCSWNEFAKAVLEEAGVTSARITGTTAAALARPAPRPARSVFDLSRYEKLTGLRPRPWRDQLRDYLATRPRAA